MVRLVTAVPMGTPGRSLGSAIRAAEENHVARFRHRDVDAEHRRVRHAMQREQGAVQIRHRDHEARARTDRQTNHSARQVRLRHRLVDDSLDIGRRESADDAGARGATRSPSGARPDCPADPASKRRRPIPGRIRQACVV